MNRGHDIQTHRLVVVYRIEPREIADAADVRRGWIEYVPDPRQLDSGLAAAWRVGFVSLSELPDLIQKLIDRAQNPERAASDRRHS